MAFRLNSHRIRTERGDDPAIGRVQISIGQITPQVGERLIHLPADCLLLPTGCGLVGR